MECKEETIKFPKNMLLGTGSSAYQIEGGWNADEKAPSIWDHYFHKTPVINPVPHVPQKSNHTKHGSFFRGINDCEYNLEDDSIMTGDIACDSYHKLDEDIKNLIDVGVNVYRFSISWPRILPHVDSRFPNEAGVQYYKNLIQKLLDNNIQPLVTMYHWDLPQSLQDIGGWANPIIVDYFSNYANFLFETFGEQVKLWCTINEPRILASGYNSNILAPAIGNVVDGVGEYMAWHNLLLSHAAAYKIYKNTFKAKQRGEVCLSLDTASYVPENPNIEEHRLACKRAYDFNIGIFIQPLVNGEYPKSVVDAVEETNKRENLKLRRLYVFTDKEKEDLIGSYDFIGFNYYTAFKVRPLTKEEYKDADNLKIKDIGIVSTQIFHNLDLSFKGFTEVIEWLVKMCENPILFITENGFEETQNQDESETKIRYHHGILTELDKAIKKGIRIKGYTMWSFMDSLEWTYGYFKKLFGIYSVDFNDSTRPRIKKPSFKFFETLFKTKTLQPLSVFTS